MKVLVCGGRDYQDRDTLFQVLDGMHATEIIHGGSGGADRLAGVWAARVGVPARIFRADWHRFGKAAGPMRNQEMLDVAKPDVVVAFPGGKGTADMVRRAGQKGTKLVRIV